MKRILDISLALIGLLIAAPVMCVIAVLLRIDSQGDTFFSQARLGKGGKIFYIHKFRKFPQNWGTKGAGVTTQNDVRMTSFGAFLERTKLDELPQLWNILKGEMSFVGPRPESVKYEHLFADGFEKLLDYTPGIFGPNQVAFRNESAMYPADQDPDQFYQNELFPQKAETDIEYFANANIVSDVKWIFKSTFGTLAGAIDWKKAKNRYALILLFDLLLFQVSWFIAHVFRFEGFNLSESNSDVYVTGVWLIPLIIFPVMLAGGVYRHPFRYFSVSDALRLATVTSSSWVLAVFVQFGFFQRNFSIGIALLSLFLFIGLLGLPRLFRRERWMRDNTTRHTLKRAVLIFGADRKGSALAKFLEQGFENVQVVGFLEEDPEVQGKYINGVKVLGGWRDREAVFSRYEISELWYASDNSYTSEAKVKDWVELKGSSFVSILNI